MTSSNNKTTSSERPIEIRVGGGQYKLGRKIGSGSFGVIYSGHHLETGNKVAIKLENAKTRHPQLQYESRIYRHMKGSKGVPNVYFYGKEGDYYVLIMDMLGPSLEDLFNYCQRSFSLKTILMIADEILARIETVHQFEFIHRDIKPDNFLLGSEASFHSIFIIDFGLSKRFINPKTRRHIKFIEGKSLTGTARYASINTHLGYEQARRDDLETLGYVLIYFARRGKLPWQGLKAQSKTQKYSKISAVKRETSVAKLCENAPPELAQYLEYTRQLEFSGKPDYAYLRGLFTDLFKRKGYKRDGGYDWCVKASRLSGGVSLISNSNKDKRRRAKDRYRKQHPQQQPKYPQQQPQHGHPPQYPHQAFSHSQQQQQQQMQQLQYLQQMAKIEDPHAQYRGNAAYGRRTSAKFAKQLHELEMNKSTSSSSESSQQSSESSSGSTESEREKEKQRKRKKKRSSKSKRKSKKDKYHQKKKAKDKERKKKRKKRKRKLSGESES